MSTFDKKRCLANIYFLAKEKNIKIGDLETAAGVSTGYLSRINKEDNETNPSVELLIAVASELGVSLDALINYEFDKQTSTEIYLLKFVEKLTQDTLNADYPWEKESKATFAELENNHNNYVQHPLFLGFDPYDEQATNIHYNSHFGNGEIVIGGDCFNAEMPDGTRIYLMRVTRRPIEVSGFELYLVQGNVTTPLCTDTMPGGFAEALTNLYAAAVESCKHIKLDTKVRGIIDAFMEGKSYTGDLPF